MSAPQAYDPDVHLNLSDLALDSHTNPSVVQLRIKQSKTDPFRQGISNLLRQDRCHHMPCLGCDPIHGSAQSESWPSIRVV